MPERKTLITNQLLGLLLLSSGFWIQEKMKEIDLLRKWLNHTQNHSIVIVDTGNDNISGFWGELATTVCMRNGVHGAVIDGGAKDTGFVKQMGFPIFCRFTSPVDGFYRSRLQGWQSPNLDQRHS